MFVMISTFIYLAMALELPPWAWKAVDKIRRGFMWRGRSDAKGGHCLLAWPKVTRPLHLGGLGIHDLKSLCWALRMRWLWLRKTQPDKLWASFPIQVHESVRALFPIAMITNVGDGNGTLFWTENWLHGSSLTIIAPHIVSLVSKQIRNKRTVREALQDYQWTQDIRGALNVTALAEFIVMVDLFNEVQLTPGVQDEHRWKFSESGQYSSKSVYETLFVGAIHFEPWELIWKSWAPKKCQFFLWLAVHDRCWTAETCSERTATPQPLCAL